MPSPLGKHGIDAHISNDYKVKCAILAIDGDISTRKALEAFWIFARNPVMKKRNECLSVKGPRAPHCERQKTGRDSDAQCVSLASTG